MIRRMVRLCVWGLGSVREAVVSALHARGALHVDDVHQREVDDVNLRRMRLLVATIEGMLEAMRWNEWDTLDDEMIERMKTHLGGMTPDVVEEIERSLEAFRIRLADLNKERSDMEETLRTLRKAHLDISHFLSFFKEEEERGAYPSLWWVPPEEKERILAGVRDLLGASFPEEGKRSARHHVVPVVGQGLLLGLSVPPVAKAAVASWLRGEGLLAWRPPAAFQKSTLRESVAAVEQGLVWVPHRLAEIESESDKASAEWGQRLGVLALLLHERADVVRLDRALSSSGDAFLLEGWIPESEREATIESLKDLFGEKVLLYWRHPEEHEWHDVPVALQNSSPFAPFELFLKMLSPPRYEGVDPTILLAVFFPLFAGCIVGDIGYGLMLGALAWYLDKRVGGEIASMAGKVLYYVTAWSIVWGVVFGEFFGDVGLRLFGLHPLWVERSHAVMPVMAFTIALGLFHVMLGLFIGFLEGWRLKSRHLWMERLGGLLVFLGILAALVIVKSELPSAFFSVGVVLGIVGVSLLIRGGGIGGIIEIFGAFGNVLSYVRIAAIGLSSAILAMVATKFVDVLGMSFFGLLLALVLHLLNFVLAVAGSGLHSARLHYVEFLGKFYAGGGKEYKPFSRRRGNTWKKDS